MKKIVVVVVLLLVCGIFFVQGRNKKKQETSNDLAKIEQVQEVCEKVVKSKALYSFGADVVKWYVYDLELMLRDGNDANKLFIEELGSDFSTKLSNGDRLFVGFYPRLAEYRIYAGDPNREGTMIYPEWEYQKVRPEE